MINRVKVRWDGGSLKLGLGGVEWLFRMGMAPLLLLHLTPWSAWLERFTAEFWFLLCVYCRICMSLATVDGERITRPIEWSAAAAYGETWSHGQSSTRAKPHYGGDGGQGGKCNTSKLLR